MGLFRMFSNKNATENIQKYLNNGAVIWDVRTKLEWDESNIPTSKHIVLNSIPENVDTIKAFQKPVITVCKSGGRSQSASDFLSEHGIDVINGGPWQNVAKLL